MATADLVVELNKDAFKMDADSEKKLTKKILELLEDNSNQEFPGISHSSETLETNKAEPQEESSEIDDTLIEDSDSELTAQNVDEVESELEDSIDDDDKSKISSNSKNNDQEPNDLSSEMSEHQKSSSRLSASRSVSNKVWMKWSGSQSIGENKADPEDLMTTLSEDEETKEVEKNTILGDAEPNEEEEAYEIEPKYDDYGTENDEADEEEEYDDMEEVDQENAEKIFLRAFKEIDSDSDSIFENPSSSDRQSDSSSEVEPIEESESEDDQESQHLNENSDSSWSAEYDSKVSKDEFPYKNKKFGFKKKGNLKQKKKK